MKKPFIFYFLLCAVALLCFASCTPEPKNSLSADVEDLLFEADDDKEELITVTTDASEVDWNFDCPDKWVKITKDGYTLKVKVEKHEGLGKRDAEITLTAGNAKPVVIPVVQSGAVPYMTLTPFEGLTFAYNATQRQELTVEPITGGIMKLQTANKYPL